MKTWLIPVTLAVAISGALLLLLAWSLGRGPNTATQPEQSSGQSARTPDTPVTGSERRFEDFGPAQPNLDLLRARCVEETRSGAALNDDPESACEQFAQASRASLPPARPAPRTPRTPFSASRSSAPPAARTDGSSLFYVVPLTDCEGVHGYGTIRYRQCRARVSEWLRRECIDTNNEADRARGEHRQNLRKWARSYCRESNRYRVTD